MPEIPDLFISLQAVEQIRRCMAPVKRARVRIRPGACAAICSAYTVNRATTMGDKVRLAAKAGRGLKHGWERLLVGDLRSPRC